MWMLENIINTLTGNLSITLGIACITWLKTEIRFM